MVFPEFIGRDAPRVACLSALGVNPQKKTMLRRMFFLVPLLIAVSTFAIESNNKMFSLSDDGTHVVLEGRWKRITGKPSVTVPDINSVRIECDKQSGNCRESMAKLIRKSDDDRGQIDKDYLFMKVEDYAVLEWTSTTLTARAKPRAADIELRISFVNKSAERTSRETSERGAKGANPIAVEHWVLE